ncbi:hypothetical protein ACFFUP_13980 [Vibrio ostreicida]|uniref:Lipoprotein n=1 Tax=Vibrio ostreicida TaxID=526588 RepID=A0ABT8C231_9VIBR|nr:hypothetical protein [Vibrio ostreicida]MDN3611155.1 hypothetical protein [Vibrio ostreicida]MDN3612275.1 hypothetical protein [Vibrio ostreicida]
MLTKTKKHAVAIAVSGVLTLTACGGSDSDSGGASSPNVVSTYHYQKIATCADPDLDGVCSQYEQQVAATSDYSRMMEVDGAILTSPAEIRIISPFTTLLHSEMLYNPDLGASVEKSKQYLNEKLGKHVGVDFLSLDISHGPVDATAMLMASLRQAQEQGSSDSSMVNIAQALDAMIKYKTLDLSAINLRTQQSRHISLDGSLLIHGSQSDTGLTRMKSIALNPANSRIIYVDANDNIKQLDTSTRQAIAYRAAEQTTITSFDDDDDDDDDDDHYGGYMDYLYGYIKNTSNELKQIVPALNSVQSYKLYTPTLTSTESFVCNNTGGNGIFLTSLQDKAGNINASVPIARATRDTLFDSYGGASGSEIPLPVPAQPTVPLSASSCFNDNFEWMVPLYQKGIIVAEINNGFNANGDQLRKLDAKTLAMDPEVYLLRSDQNTVVFSKDDRELLLISDDLAAPQLLQINDFSRTLPLTINDVSTASFATNGQLVVALASKNTLIWTNKLPNTQQLGTVDIDGKVKLMDSSPNGKFTVAVTTTSLYLLDNVTRTIARTLPYDASKTTHLFVQNDKAITIHNTGVEYFQFANISGPRLKVAAQLVTRQLIDNWQNTSAPVWGPTNLSFILDPTEQNDQITETFSDIGLNWIPASATQANQVTGVYITGRNRGERTKIYKPL